MGDDRAGTRAPGAAPAAEKKTPAPDAGGGGAVPEGAAAAPQSALTMLEASYAPQLLGVLQGAGGNAAVNQELTSLQKGQAVASQAKTDKDQIDGMTDGAKVEKYGGKGGGGGGGDAGGDPAAKAEAPPPGTPDPGAAAGFHSRRAGELQSLAGQHLTVSSTLAGAAGTAGLPGEVVAFLTSGSSQNAQQAASLQGLAAQYAAASAALAGSPYIGAAMPTAGTAAMYQVWIDSLISVIGSVDSMVGAFDGAFAAEQAKIGECDTQITTIQAQMAEAQAAAKAGAGGGGAGAPGGAAPGAAPAGGEQKGLGSTPPGQDAKPAAPAGGDAAGGGGGGGASGKSAKGGGGESKGAAPSSGSTGNTGLSSPAPDAAQAKAPDAAPGAAAGGGGGGGAAAAAEQAAAIAGMAKQIEDQKSKKTSIEGEVAAHQAFYQAIKTFDDQMKGLLAAYQGGSTPPAGGGG